MEYIIRYEMTAIFPWQAVEACPSRCWHLAWRDSLSPSAMEEFLTGLPLNDFLHILTAVAEEMEEVWTNIEDQDDLEWTSQELSEIESWVVALRKYPAQPLDFALGLPGPYDRRLLQYALAWFLARPEAVWLLRRLGRAQAFHQQLAASLAYVLNPDLIQYVLRAT